MVYVTTLYGNPLVYGVVHKYLSFPGHLPISKKKQPNKTMSNHQIFLSISTEYLMIVEKSK